MSDLKAKVVIITGAAGNLGQAVAHAFLAHGARLVLVDHAPDRLQRIFPQLANSEQHYLADSVDLTDPSATGSMVAQSLARMGRIDVLANCVGGFRSGGRIQETSLDEWDYMMNLNARSALIVSQAVIPAMLEQGSGKIIHVAARAALEGQSRMAPYSAAKSAVIRLTESLSAEVKRSGVNVNCILPSTIDTPQNREAMPGAKFDRWVSPDDLAAVILFLGSDAARAIHGAAIPVFGTG